MRRKLKPINNLNKVISKNEIQLLDKDFAGNNLALPEAIESHIENATCFEGEWRMWVFGFLNISEIKNFVNKPCFFRINMDLHFYKEKDMSDLIKKHSIQEVAGFKTIQLEFMGAVIIYRE